MIEGRPENRRTRHDLGFGALGMAALFRYRWPPVKSSFFLYPAMCYPAMSVPDLSSLRIRPATEQDVPAITKLLCPFVDDGKLLPRSEDEAPDLVTHGFVAEVAGEPVGFAALEIYSRKLSEIRSLAVDVRFQNAGIGRQLIRTCVDRARERNIHEVMAVTSSEGFFKSCGFDFALPGERKALFIQTDQ